MHRVIEKHVLSVEGARYGKTQMHTSLAFVCCNEKVVVG